MPSSVTPPPIGGIGGRVAGASTGRAMTSPKRCSATLMPWNWVHSPTARSTGCTERPARRMQAASMPTVMPPSSTMRLPAPATSTIVRLEKTTPWAWASWARRETP